MFFLSGGTPFLFKGFSCLGGPLSSLRVRSARSLLLLSPVHPHSRPGSCNTSCFYFYF